MKIPNSLKGMFGSAEFQDLKFEEVVGAMHDTAVRRHWLEAVLAEIKEIHMRTHTALMEGELDERFVQESARLRGIDWALRQILNSKTSVELERRHNRDE